MTLIHILIILRDFGPLLKECHRESFQISQDIKTIKAKYLLLTRWILYEHKILNS